MKRPGSHGKVLDAFRRGEIHILMGTQMIAKGLDFPNVTLVGVVNADVGLHHADFRAAERTFQLLAQVAGRTGRGSHGGHVYVQTMSPEHPASRWRRTHDYRHFARGGDAASAGAQLSALPAAGPADRPQQGREGRQRIRRSPRRRVSAGAGEASSNGRRAGRAASARARRSARCFGSRGTIASTSSCNRRSSAFLHEVLRAVLPTVRLPQSVELTVDIDPQDML